MKASTAISQLGDLTPETITRIIILEHRGNFVSWQAAISFGLVTYGRNLVPVAAAGYSLSPGTTAIYTQRQRPPCEFWSLPSVQFGPGMGITSKASWIVNTLPSSD